VVSVESVLDDDVVRVDEVKNCVCIVLLTGREDTDLVHGCQVSECIFQVLPNFDIQSELRWLAWLVGNEDVEVHAAILVWSQARAEDVRVVHLLLVEPVELGVDHGLVHVQD